MSKIQLRVDDLNAMSPAKIVENEKVEAKFIQMYNAIHGRDKGLQAYTKEKFNFQKVLHLLQRVCWLNRIFSIRKTGKKKYLKFEKTSLSLKQNHPICKD